MAPPALDDDVLRQILSYLHGRDALNAALASKYLYELAAPRIAAVAKCEKPSDLRKLRNYMLSGSPPHARDLEDLAASIMAFDSPEHEQADTGGFRPCRVFSESQALLLGDILAQAPRLRSLELLQLRSCVLADPRIADALAAMDRLTTADFAGVTDGVWARVPRLPAALRELWLLCSRIINGNFKEDDDPSTVPPLLKALAPLQHLHTLELWHFHPPPTPGGESSLPWLPSVRNLKIYQSAPSAFEVVGRCSRLVNLSITFAPAYRDTEARRKPLHDGPQWPALRTLTLCRPKHIKYILHRVGTVESVRIPHKDLVVGTCGSARADKARIEDFLQLLARTSPVSLSMCVAVSEKTSGVEIWRRVPALAPRLRFLQLQVSVAALPIDNKYWLDTVPAALDTLPLVYLSVVARTGAHHATPICADLLTLQSDDPVKQAQLAARAVEAEGQRRLSVDALPARLAGGIPSLRFLAVASAEPQVSPSEYPGLDDPRSVFEISRCIKADKEDFVARYWRIEEGGASGQTRGLQELSAREGERTQALVDDLQFQTLMM